MHKHRATRIVRTEVRHAAQQQPLRHSFPMAAYDDEVSTLLFSHRHNGVPATGEPACDVCVCVNHWKNRDKGKGG